LIGVDATRRLLITGDRIDAREAYRLGLINRICENPLALATQIAERLTNQFTAETLAMPGLEKEE
jgi:enoyl-CoA hydratase/carnithine racemase